LFRSMLAGLPQAYTALAERVKESGAKPPFMSGSIHIASILTYLYDVPTVLFGGRTAYGLEHQPANDALTRGEFEGKSAIGLDAFTMGRSVLRYARFSGDYLEPSVGKIPRAIIPYDVPMDIGIIGGKTFELEVPASYRQLVTQVGKLDERGALRTTGRGGSLQNGPFVRLEPGQYEVDWIGRVGSVGNGKHQGNLDIIFDSGKSVLATAPLRLQSQSASETWLGGIDFNLDRQTQGIEFRLRVTADVDISLTRLRLRRIVSR
jgi:hypothetical protein